MKKTILNSLTVVTLFFASAANAQVGVGVPAGDIHPSAELEVKSTTKGFLPPRLTNAERNSIATPATGLLIYQTDAVANNPAGLYFYDGTAWRNGLGVVGAKGDQGIPGEIGAQGPIGPAGANGINGTNGSVGSVTGISGTSNANGAFISDGELTLTPADPSNGGIVTTHGQSFAGFKAFLEDLNVNGVIVGRGTGDIISNTALGNLALLSNTTGDYNTAIGSSAMRSNTTGVHNTAIGSSAMKSNITGVANTANGSSALLFNTTGDYNTAIGSSALLLNTIGNQNTAIGRDALLNNKEGNENTALGIKADVAAGNLSNATAIGAQAVVDASNKIQLGNGSVTSVNTSGTYTGAGFRTPTGTSSQYLMADGSVSSTGPQGANGQGGVITAGANIAIAGTGTVADPYIVSSKIYTIGLWPELGGYVFRISADGRHGLVAETQDDKGEGLWFTAQDDISNPLNHSTNGQKFMDWRLPTKYELNEMYLQKDAIGGFNKMLYWSSTEYAWDNTFAWMQNFLLGTQSAIYDKSKAIAVRSVRAF